MSIAGQLAKSSPLNPADVDLSLSALTENPIQTPQRWRNTGVAFGCCNDANLDSFVRHGDEFAAQFWGRIDNRTTLEGELGETKNEAGLLLRAYLRWGIDFLDRVVGEFCCALWDGRQGCLLLGRDIAGKRPLVYHDSAQRLHFSAEPRGLLALPSVPGTEVDENSLADWFAGQPIPKGHTFRQEIRRVPTGHIVTIDGKGARLHRYWRPEERPMLRLRRDEEYAEALLATLEEAVSCRLPPDGEVASTLSAGLDSPSVTALAARLLHQQGRRLIAFTAVPQAGFDASGRFPGRVWDEGPLAGSLARMYPNIDHVLVSNNAGPLLDALKRGISHAEAPPNNVMNTIWFHAMYETAQSRGVKTFLVGQAGNGSISYDGMLLLPMLLSKLRWLALGNELLRLRQAGLSWFGLADKTIGPVLPEPVHDAVRSIFGKQAYGLHDFGCFNPSFVHENRIHDRASQRGYKHSIFGMDSRQLRLRMLRRVDGGVFGANARRNYGFQTCDPTADKRVLELCLSIPEDQYLHDGEPRSLVRRALSGILPPELLANRRIGLQSADCGMTLAQQLPDLLAELDRLESSPLVQRYLDVPQMRRRLTQLADLDWISFRESGRFFQLARALSAGLFIHKIENGWA